MLAGSVPRRGRLFLFSQLFMIADWSAAGSGFGTMTKLRSVFVPSATSTSRAPVRRERSTRTACPGFFAERIVRSVPQVTRVPSRARISSRALIARAAGESPFTLVTISFPSRSQISAPSDAPGPSLGWTSMSRPGTEVLRVVDFLYRVA